MSLALNSGEGMLQNKETDSLFDQYYEKLRIEEDDEHEEDQMNIDISVEDDDHVENLSREQRSAELIRPVSNMDDPLMMLDTDEGKRIFNLNESP